MGDLGEFQGKPIVASKVVVKKAGDGLTKPLAAEPRAFMSGDRVPMLLWGTWGSIGFDPTKEGHGFVQVHDFDTEEAAVLDHVDPAMLEDLLTSQREKVRRWEIDQMRAKNEEKGIIEFPGIDGDVIDVGETGGEMSEAEWMDEARSSAVSPIGSKQAKKARG
jgi:hypothetical protein